MIKDTLRNVKAVLLDVRGTVIDEKKDIEINAELANLITDLIKKNVYIVFLSACSLETLKDLVLNKLDSSTKILMYLNSSCLAYTYSEDSEIVRLSNYEFSGFSETESDGLKESVGYLNMKYNLNDIELKEKTGQFNYYCGGAYSFRTELAIDLNHELNKKQIMDLRVLVPTSKDTIDIAKLNKSHGVSDLLSRFDLNSQECVFVSDSLQKSGADLCVIEDFPEIISFQVGKIKSGDVRIDSYQDSNLTGHQTTSNVLRDIVGSID